MGDFTTIDNLTWQALTPCHMGGFNPSCAPYKIFFQILSFVTKINLSCTFEKYPMMETGVFGPHYALLFLYF